MTASTGQNKDQPLISLYYEVLGTLINELKRRLSECNSRLMEFICTLLLFSKNFLDFEQLKPLIDLVSKSGTTIDSSLLHLELSIVRNYKKFETEAYQHNRTVIDKFLE